jgi:hypothetical protein
MSVYICSMFVLSCVALRQADPRLRSPTDRLQDITVSELILSGKQARAANSSRQKKKMRNIHSCMQRFWPESLFAIL